jgi:hypothetical protein
MRRLGRIQISGKLRWPTSRPKLYRLGRDTVEEVAAKGRSSGESDEQQREGMNSTKNTARIAGLLYLVNGVTGFFSDQSAGDIDDGRGIRCRRDLLGPVAFPLRDSRI